MTDKKVWLNNGKIVLYNNNVSYEANCICVDECERLKILAQNKAEQYASLFGYKITKVENVIEYTEYMDLLEPKFYLVCFFLDDPDGTWDKRYFFAVEVIYETKKCVFIDESIIPKSRVYIKDDEFFTDFRYNDFIFRHPNELGIVDTRVGSNNIIHGNDNYYRDGKFAPCLDDRYFHIQYSATVCIIKNRKDNEYVLVVSSYHDDKDPVKYWHSSGGGSDLRFTGEIAKPFDDFIYETSLNLFHKYIGTMDYDTVVIMSRPEPFECDSYEEANEYSKKIFEILSLTVKSKRNSMEVYSKKSVYPPVSTSDYKIREGYVEKVNDYLWLGYPKYKYLNSEIEDVMYGVGYCVTDKGILISGRSPVFLKELKLYRRGLRKFIEQKYIDAGYEDEDGLLNMDDIIKRPPFMIDQNTLEDTDVNLGE